MNPEYKSLFFKHVHRNTVKWQRPSESYAQAFSRVLKEAWKLWKSGKHHYGAGKAFRGFFEESDVQVPAGSYKNLLEFNQDQCSRIVCFKNQI